MAKKSLPVNIAEVDKVYEQSQAFMHSAEETDIRLKHRKIGTRNTFKYIEVNKTFFINGTRYKKVSTRTAINLYYGGKSYIRNYDICIEV